MTNTQKTLRHDGVKVVAMRGVAEVGSALAIFGDHDSRGHTSLKTPKAPARNPRGRDRGEQGPYSTGTARDGRGMNHGTRASAARDKRTHPGSAIALRPQVGLAMSRVVSLPQLRLCGAAFGVISQRKRDGQFLPRRGAGVT